MADGYQRVIIPYAPRKQFQAYHKRKERFACLVCHRRAGKTVATLNDLQRRALTSSKDNYRAAYIAPFYAQAKDVAWDYIKRFAAPIPGVEFNESELRVDYPNGARIRLYGADNYNRMRGIYLDDAALDEYGDMDPRAWSEVLRPALADREGTASFIGTPKGNNHFREIYERAADEPGWYRLTLKSSETNLINPEELKAARKEMTEDQFEQEFECSFDAAIIGAYYGRDMNAAEADGRIGGVGYDRAVPVYTAWDLGIDDSTAIWFAQFVGREIHIIDYLEASGEALDYYYRELAAKPYAYAGHYLPHDAQAKELGTGRTRVETLQSLGLNKVTIVPAQSVEDGINAVRMMLPRCWFDKTKAKRGIDCLRNYQREFDDKTKAFRMKPLHNWASHGADAFRYLAMGMPKPQTSQMIIRPRFGTMA
jgi:hypothetical protein